MYNPFKNPVLAKIYVESHKEKVETNDYNGMPYVELVFDPVIFAEKIILECSETGFKVFNDDKDATASDLQYLVREAIKKRFGV